MKEGRGSIKYLQSVSFRSTLKVPHLKNMVDPPLHARSVYTIPIHMLCLKLPDTH